MAAELTFDMSQVLPFARSIMPMPASEGMRGFGLVRNGEVVAAALYEGFNGHNIWVHCCAVPGRHWMNRLFLHTGFRYPFVTCGVSRLSAYVSTSNEDSVRFVRHCGFEEEARLRGAAADGGDLIVFVMTPETCRYI